MTRLLNRVIGADDLVGIMTPDMSARNLTLARRTETIEGILKNNWFWGERNRINSPDPQRRGDQGLLSRCRRDRGLGETDHCPAPRRQDARRDRRSDRAPRRDPRRAEVRGDADGGLAPAAGRSAAGSAHQSTRRQVRAGARAAANRHRSRRAADDESGARWPRRLVRRLRARTRAGGAERLRPEVSRSDSAGQSRQRQLLSARRPRPGRLRRTDRSAPGRHRRRSMLRGCGRGRMRCTSSPINTDGYAILNTNNIDKALERMVQDAGAYYLLGYYSTNTRARRPLPQVEGAGEAAGCSTCDRAPVIRRRPRRTWPRRGSTG